MSTLLGARRCRSSCIDASHSGRPPKTSRGGFLDSLFIAPGFLLPCPLSAGFRWGDLMPEGMEGVAVGGASVWACCSSGLFARTTKAQNSRIALRASGLGILSGEGGSKSISTGAAASGIIFHKIRSCVVDSCRSRTLPGSRTLSGPVSVWDTCYRRRTRARRGIGDRVPPSCRCMRRSSARRHKRGSSGPRRCRAG